MSQIQTNIETTQEDNDTIFNCSIKEALCDSESITLVFEVSAKEKDKYLFIPEDAIPEDVMRLESSFELKDMSTTTTDTYVCGEETSEEGFFKVEKAEVIQTDLGTYVDVFYINENGQNPEDGLTFRIVDQLGNKYVCSGVDWIEGNHYKERCILNKSEIGDILSIEAFDCYEKNVYGVTKLYIEAMD